MAEHVSPDLPHILAAVEAAPDTPVVMLNLNRYRDAAVYGPDSPHSASHMSGRQAYLRYGVMARDAIEHVGGRILWATDAREVLIGCEHDRYDEVVAVWYPNRRAFLDLATFPGYEDALEHRDAGVEQAVLLALDGEDEPVLRSPF